MKKVFILCAAFFYINIFSLNAFDFGVVINQDVNISVPGTNSEKNDLDIQGIVIPRFTTPIGETGDLYVSLGVNYRANSQAANPFLVVPELTRTDFSFSLGYANISIGRMFYSDPLKLIADGLFDGARVSFITRSGNISAGCWYTGLLYKNRAVITMTDKELKSRYAAVDYSDFGNTYFAPSRFLFALEYDHPSLAGFLGLKTAMITQFDTSEERLHSQYFTAALSLPIKSFVFDLGGCFELIEHGDTVKPALAADFGVTWMLPTKLEKHLKLSGRISSGVSKDESVGAFLPITTVPQGEIAEAKFSGLSLFSADFTGRLANAVSANGAFTYFIRNDLGTYRYYPVNGADSEGFFLGAELFGRVIWNITSDVRLNFGTGVFLPALGDAAPKAKTVWRAELNVVLSVY